MTASAALDAFHAAAPVRRLPHGGVEWQYRVAGSGTQGLLLLPGAVGDGDAYFTLAPLLSSTHTLIAIAYPPVDSLTALLDGLRYILDREAHRLHRHRRRLVRRPDRAGVPAAVPAADAPRRAVGHRTGEA